MGYSINDEKCQQTELSPGIVQDHEFLLRVIFEPEHVLDGKVIETAISLSDLESRGFSVDRYEHADKSVIQKRIDRQIQNSPENRHSGKVSKFCCLSVRGIYDDDNERSFIVIDTAMAENKAHASVYSAIERKKSALRKIRSLLIPYLQERLSLEEVFS